MSVAGVGTGASAVWYSRRNAVVSGVEDLSANDTTAAADSEARNAAETSPQANTASPTVLSLSTETLLVLQVDAVEGSTDNAPQLDAALEDKSVVERIGNVDVIVSGHSIDNREGVSLLRTVSGAGLNYSPEMAAQIKEDAEAAAKMSVTPMDVRTIEVPGGMSVYMPITYLRQEGDWNRGNPLDTPIDLGDFYFQQDTESFMKLVGVERRLKEEYGDDVKLAYSHQDGGYIMLTPGDLHYDEIPSTEDGVAAILETVNRGFRDADSVRDVLADYGYKV